MYERVVYARVGMGGVYTGGYGRGVHWWVWAGWCIYTEVVYTQVVYIPRVVVYPGW